MKIVSKLIAVAVILAVAAGVWFGYRKFAKPENAVQFRTEVIEKGDLMSVISSSGTVEPEELVNVGAQVTGKIMAFGTDVDGKTVDYGSRVKKGMVLARIDEVLYEAELREAEAGKAKAEVAILSAKASIQQSNAKLVLATLNWNRAKELHPKGALSKSDYDTNQAAFLSAKADLAVSEAQLKQAEAQLQVAEAALVKAKRNLSYCVITSPVDGIIIDRRVSVGQTLVSSMSASSIFLIATDLRKMQVWVSVNEADIGSIKPGMKVIFSVDAYPDAEFVGQVHKIRLNATMSQNVVTYVVEVTTDNADGKLLPYLTANVKFVRAECKNVLIVSNAAFRYTPDVNSVAPAYRKELEQERTDRSRRLWVPAGKGLLKPVYVKTGLNTGISSQILSGDVKEGTVVVNGQSEIAAAPGPGGSAQRSPFLPQPPRRGNRNQNRARAGR
ncbi:MAG: efflux RND transporter periplasmic adaptor subunit [Lentisphaeria bacterium]|nr:efflux RND transporter periplasmic adaptor subunit [Lentisphaeria bacterium]